MLNLIYIVSSLCFTLYVPTSSMKSNSGVQSRKLWRLWDGNVFQFAPSTYIDARTLPYLIEGAVPGKNVMQKAKTCGRQACEVLRESKENVYHGQMLGLEDSDVSRMHWDANVFSNIKDIRTNPLWSKWLWRDWMTNFNYDRMRSHCSNACWNNKGKVLTIWVFFAEVENITFALVVNSTVWARGIRRSWRGIWKLSQSLLRWPHIIMCTFDWQMIESRISVWFWHAVVPAFASGN